jgi:hypothetical protein
VPDYVFLVGPIIVGALLAARWSYALAATRGKPPEWEAPRRDTWPFRSMRRDAYRRSLVRLSRSS